MSEMKLSERLRVRAALCDTVDITLSREQALAMVKVLERETEMIETMRRLEILVADNDARQAQRDKLLRDLSLSCSYFYASSLWIIGSIT